MKLAMEVGLNPSYIVLDGEPAPPQKTADGDPAASEKGHSPQFSVHVCCGQMAGWIKMPLGTEVGLNPATLC